MRIAALFALMLPLQALAGECAARSGPGTAALVELYTSEGCSSCPPADRWMSKLAGMPPGKVVPVAFHVTYWDYIGWRDPFASERHTARQRERASASGARYVYTPQVTVGGRDFRSWHDGTRFEQAVQRINLTPARARIEITVKEEAGRWKAEARATLEPGVAAGDLALAIVATQNGLASRVTAGENRGEHLRHDFVVRDFAEVRPFPATRAASATLILPRPLSIAAFVQNLKTGEVLQALGC